MEFINELEQKFRSCKQLTFYTVSYPDFLFICNSIYSYNPTAIDVCIIYGRGYNGVHRHLSIVPRNTVLEM